VATVAVKSQEGGLRAEPGQGFGSDAMAQYCCPP
jgi:hypothetical protein